MNSLNKRFRYEMAQPEDGPELLEILEESDFKGQIALVYTRRPDPFASFHMEGKNTVILLCRDTTNNKIASFGAFTIRRLYVNGVEDDVGYLFGLRMRKEYRGRFPLIPKGYRMLREMVEQTDIKYHITTILDENIYARRLLEKKRSFMPAYIPLTRFGTFIFKTGNRAKTPWGYVLKRAAESDMPEVFDFISQQGKRNQFYPVLAPENFSEKTFPGLETGDFLILYDGENKIAACGAAWDQRGYKQYILKEYGGVMEFFRHLSGFLTLFGFPPLPKPGTVLDFFTLSFWAARDDDPEILKIYISLVAAEMRHYPFFLIGATSASSLYNALKRMSFISYRSRAYLVDWEKSGAATDLDGSLPVYLECGLL